MLEVGEEEVEPSHILKEIGGFKKERKEGRRENIYSRKGHCYSLLIRPSIFVSMVCNFVGILAVSMCVL